VKGRKTSEEERTERQGRKRRGRRKERGKKRRGRRGSLPVQGSRHCKFECRVHASSLNIKVKNTTTDMIKYKT